MNITYTREISIPKRNIEGAINIKNENGKTEHIRDAINYVILRTFISI